MPLFYWGGVMTSCKKEIAQAGPEVPNPIFPTTDAMKERVALLKDVSKMLKVVYQDPKAYYEVNAAILSGYYEDERVLLKDLLFPETSPLYKREAFKKFAAEPGHFKKRFYAALDTGSYPHLEAALNAKKRIYNNQLSGIKPIQELSAAVPADTSLEIFSNSNGVSIYFPYSENFGSNFTPAFFDNINTDPLGNLATIVAADRQADSGPGEEPTSQMFISNDGIVSFIIDYRTVTVDDDYAELKPTHIVGIGADPRNVIMEEPIPTNPAYVVFIGEVKCTFVKYDHLISFNGTLQSGGPDIRFCRGDAYLTLNANQQITTPQGIVAADLTRKQARKGSWVPIYSIWDSNWEPDNKEQIFAIYEEDKQGTVTINLSQKTTVKVDDLATAERNVGFSLTFITQDLIQTQLSWNRASFFQFNRGGLNNGCGTRNGWQIYDCNSRISYTMPVQ